MQEEFDLPDLAVEDARHGHQRPKIEEYGDSLFAVLQAVEMRDDELHVGEIDIFVGPNYVLSVRRDTERGFADVRARSENEPDLLMHGAAYVLYALMDKVVDRYFPVLEALETRAGIDRGADLRAQYRALQYRGLVRVEAQADDAQARGRSADGGRRQALRRPRAAHLRRHGRVFPRRVRPSAAAARIDRGHTRHADDGDPGQPGHDQPERNRGDQKAGRRGPPSSRCRR